MNQSILSAEDIFSAYRAHGDNFLVINLDKNSIKKNQAETVKYGQVKIKKENGIEVVPIIKFINLSAAGKIKSPQEREYEQIKIALRRDDASNTESMFGKAMELICNTFMKRVKELKAAHLISDDADDDENKPNCLIVPNAKAQTPLQKKAKNKEGNTVDLENPMLWLGLNFKRYSKDEEKKLEVLEFGYKTGNPFLVKEFELNVYDLDKIKNKRPQLAYVDDEKIKNHNVHKFITVGSLISGTISMQIVMSKQSFNLNTRLTKDLYVKRNKNPGMHAALFDDDELLQMASEAGKKLESSNAEYDEEESKHEENAKEEEIDDYGDEEDSDIKKKLDELSFSCSG